TGQPTPGRSVRSGPAEAGRPVFLAQCRWHIRTEAALATNPMIGSLAGAVPAVHPEAWIAPGAVVIGSVRLGRAASVWYGAVLRADDDEIIVGPECNIQDLCCLHVDPGEPVVLEDRVSLGHHATVHGAHVGAGALTEICAVVLGGARIGAATLVAAGTVVPPGREFPAGVLVAGVPGRVVRELTDDDRAVFADTAANYAARAIRHRGVAWHQDLAAGGPGADGPGAAGPGAGGP